MGQKTNPIGNRLGIIRGWESNWYGGNDYGDKLAEDHKLRKYVFARLSKASVSRVIIERTLKLVTLTITTVFFVMISRPPGPTPLYSSAASDVYKGQALLPWFCGKTTRGLNVYVAV